MHRAPTCFTLMIAAASLLAACGSPAPDGVGDMMDGAYVTVHQAVTSSSFVAAVPRGEVAVVEAQGEGHYGYFESSPECPDDWTLDTGGTDEVGDRGDVHLWVGSAPVNQPEGEFHYERRDGLESWSPPIAAPYIDFWAEVQRRDGDHALLSNPDELELSVTSTEKRGVREVSYLARWASGESVSGSLVVEMP